MTLEKSALPIGWAQARLGELVEPSKEKVSPLKIQEMLYIGLEHIEKDTGKLVGFGHLSDVRSTKTRFQQGDLLYGRLRPYLNKVHVAEFDGICSTDILVFPKNAYLSTKFVGYRLLSSDFVRYASQNVSGVQHPRVSFETLSRFMLNLSPFNEQVRIVAKLEKLFTRLDTGVERLRKVKAQLKRYRQAILRYALEGKLTEEWRKTHQHELEPATKLLQQIKEERKKKMKERHNDRPLLRLDGLAELPDGWAWTNSGSISWFVTSGSRDWKKYYDDSGPRFIRTQDINTNKLNLDNVAHVSLPERTEGKRSLVEKNDILIIITGANVGKVAMVEREIGEAYVSQSVALMKLVMPEIAKFVRFAMIADGFGKTQLDMLVYGMGRPVLSLENVQNIALPLAPLMEQQQIVNEIERKLSEADKVEKMAEQSLKYSERLRQSILKAAFEGKLVPQDLSDESASKLLERIKHERAKSKGEKDIKRRMKSKPRQLELSSYVK